MGRRIRILICVGMLFCFSLIACGNTKTMEKIDNTEFGAGDENQSATYEEKIDIFLVSNSIYGQNYSDGNSIDMNSLNPKGGKVITESEVNIYNQQKECIGYIKSGVTLTMATQSDEWSYVYVTDGGFIVRTEDIKDLTNQNNVENTENSQKVEDPTYTDTEMSKIMYVKQNVNVRSGPSTDYGTVGSLNANDEVIVTGESGTGWYQIKYNNGYAYVNAKYLSDTKTEVNTTPSNNGGNTNENENNSSDETVPPINNDIGYVPIEPEPTYTYTVDEVIAIVRSTLEGGGMVWSLDYASKEDIDEFGPDLGMGWGIVNISMTDPYTDAQLLLDGYLWDKNNLYYLEYQGTENGAVVLKAYWGTQY